MEYFTLLLFYWNFFSEYGRKDVGNLFVLQKGIGYSTIVRSLETVSVIRRAGMKWRRQLDGWRIERKKLHVSSSRLSCSVGIPAVTRTSSYTTKDNKCHIKVSLTLTFKVKCQGQVIGFVFSRSLTSRKLESTPRSCLYYIYNQRYGRSY